MFGRRPRIDTTFGVPMDLNAPSGAMLERDKRPQSPSTIITPEQTFRAPPRHQTKQSQATRPVTASMQFRPTRHQQPSAKDMARFAKYLLPPIGLRASLAICLGVWIVLGPVIFFLAAAAYVGVAYMRWHQSLVAQK